MPANENKQYAQKLIDRLKEVEIDTGVRFLEFMILDPVSRSLAIAPIEDEPLTEEEESAKSFEGVVRAQPRRPTRRSWPNSG